MFKKMLSSDKDDKDCTFLQPRKNVYELFVTERMLFLWERKEERKKERERKGGGEDALPTIVCIKGWWQQQYDKSLKSNV